VTGNFIEKCGFKTDGTPRVTTAAGISVRTALRDAIISQNQIVDVSGVGIQVQPTVSLVIGDFSVDKLIITENMIQRTGKSCILVASGGDNRPFRAVMIQNNILEASADNFAALAVSMRNGTGSETSIRGNMIVRGSETATLWGIVTHSNPGLRYQITDNTLKDLDVGISTWLALLGGGLVSLGYASHKQVGKDILISRNAFYSCSEAFRYSVTGGLPRLAVLSPDNMFYGSTPKPSKRINVIPPQAVIGRIYGYSDAGEPLFEISATEFPTSTGLSYEKGEKVLNPDPTAGGFTGWICTEGGSPGVWKTFGPISS
jgi:hypothetical protein